MKKPVFELLNNQQKIELILASGKFLANYDEGNDLCDVYELFTFYVAVCYKSDQDVEPVITSHSYPDQLPHLTKIQSFDS